MIEFKDGVSLFNLSPQASLGMGIVDSIFEYYGEKVCRVTSVSDYVKGRVAKSLHPHGKAWDVGIRGTTHNVEDIAQDCKKSLGRHFDVVLKSDHIHFEWDPKQ